MRLSRCPGSAGHPGCALAGRRGRCDPHPPFRVPPRARAAPGHQGRHAGAPCAWCSHRLQRPRPAYQPCRRTRPGDGRIRRAPGPHRRGGHARARRSPRLRCPRGDRCDRLSPTGARRAFHLRPHPARRGLRQRDQLRHPCSRAGGPAHRTPRIPARRRCRRQRRHSPRHLRRRNRPPPRRRPAERRRRADHRRAVPASPNLRHEAFRAAIDLAARTIDSGAVTALVASLAAPRN